MSNAAVTPRRVRLGRLPVDRLTFDEALRSIAALVEGRRGGKIFTPNVDHVVMGDSDERFFRAYDAVDLSLADGMFVVWALRVLGVPTPEKISGSDLVGPLLTMAEEKGWRVYLLGGNEGVAAKAVERLAVSHPKLQVVGFDSPWINMDEPPEARAEIVARARAARPDLILVCLGAPKQELFIHEAAAALSPAVLAGVGASIDFLAGTAQRAPAWISRSGLEWLYRLLQEPRRLWRRYLVRDPGFALIVLRELVRRSDMVTDRGAP